MRLLIDSLIALMLVAILAGVIYHHRQQQERVRQYQTAHRELAQLRETMTYYKALENDTVNEYGYPPYIAPSWFPQGLPTNRLIPGRHPWVDIAPPGDMNDQPPDPVIYSEKQAGYWYNPNRGIIRARISEQFTEQATLALYNQINTTMLVSLSQVNDPARRTLPHPLLVNAEDNESQNPNRPTLLGTRPLTAQLSSPASTPASSPASNAAQPAVTKVSHTLMEVHSTSEPSSTRATLGRPSLLDPQAVSSGQ